MKEKIKDKKYLLGYALQIFGLRFLVAYGLNFQSGIVLTFQLGFSEGFYFKATPDYSSMYMALAVNFIMILISLAVLIYGIAFVRKNKQKKIGKHKILKIILKVIATVTIIGFIFLIFVLYFFSINIVTGEDYYLPHSPTAAMTAATITLASDSDDTDIFMVDVVTMDKEDASLLINDKIRLRFDYNDKTDREIVYFYHEEPFHFNISYDYRWQNNKENDDILLYHAGRCSFDDSGKLTVSKDGYFEYGYIISAGRVINRKLPLMHLYEKSDYDFLWRTEDIKFTFELLPEYFIYAKEFGSYTHIEKYTDFDYETKYSPVVVPAGANRKMVKGSCVCIKNSADDYNGTNLFDYVYDREYRISQIDGDRAVITFDGEIIAAMNTADLYFATEIQ